MLALMVVSITREFNDISLLSFFCYIQPTIVYHCRSIDGDDDQPQQNNNHSLPLGIEYFKIQANAKFCIAPGNEARAYAPGV